MESDQDQHQQAVDLCQQVPSLHPQNQMARNDLERQPLGQIKSTSHQPGSEKEEMGLDRPHPTQVSRQHHKASARMESPRKEESGKAKEDVEKNCGGRGEGRRMDVGSAEEDGPEPSRMARCRCSLMLLKEPRGISQVKSRNMLSLRRSGDLE